MVELENRRKVRQIIDRAVEKAHMPGQPTLGTTPGEGTIGAIVSSGLENPWLQGVDGGTSTIFVLGVSTLGDPNARLAVSRGTRDFRG